jgi:hypothetical protein
MRAILRRTFGLFLLAVLAYGAVTLVSTSNAYARPHCNCPPGCFCPGGGQLCAC